MAVLGHGMQVRVREGVGWMQFRVVNTPDRCWVPVAGLVPEGVSVADGQFPGWDRTPGCGWDGSGRVDWTLRGRHPAKNTVTFGQGDRVMVVLDCRQGPLVRLLVNSRPRQVHHLATPAGADILFPAIALYGRNDSDVRGVKVELEPRLNVLLPIGWDAAPS